MGARVPTSGRGVTAVQHPPNGSGSGVLMFNSRSGNVTSQPGDYTAAQVTGAADLSSGSQQAFTGEIKAPDVLVTGLAGANIQARLVGATTSGAPTTGTFAQGDLVVDLSGALWICTTAGTPGTWGNAGSSAGVSAFNSRSGAVSPTTGDYTAAQVTNAADLSSASQQAFTAEVKAKDFAVAGLTGATQASRIVGGTTSGAPTTGTFAVRDIAIDGTGAIWVCITAGTPGTWRNIGSAVATTPLLKPLYFEGTDAGVGTIVFTLYVAQILVPTTTTLTGVTFRASSVPNTTGIVSLYNAAGARVAVSNTLATVGGSVNRLPFTGTYTAAGGTYLIGLQTNNSMTLNGSIAMVPCAALAQGSLAAPGTITPPTVPSGSVQPSVCTY